MPCYNEAATIPDILAQVRAVNLEKQIIAVDDSSSDDTYAVLCREAAADPSMIVIRHPTNRGKGAAVRSGLARASGEIVIVQDADLEYNPETGEVAELKSGIILSDAPAYSLKEPSSQSGNFIYKVEVFDGKLRQLIKDMAETMYHNNGIGLAAIQINVQKQVIILDLSGSDEPNHLMVFINPEILSKSGEVIGEEGCLSVPGVYESVKRSEKIQLKFQDVNGKEQIINCDGLFAGPT